MTKDKFIQIVALDNILFGLMKSGKIYKYILTTTGMAWIPLPDIDYKKSTK